MFSCVQLFFRRAQKNGTLTVDGSDMATVIAPGGPKNIEVIPPYFIGGLPETAAAKAISNLEVIQCFVRIGIQGNKIYLIYNQNC